MAFNNTVDSSYLMRTKSVLNVLGIKEFDEADKKGREFQRRNVTIGKHIEISVIIFKRNNYLAPLLLAFSRLQRYQLENKFPTSQLIRLGSLCCAQTILRLLVSKTSTWTTFAFASTSNFFFSIEVLTGLEALKISSSSSSCGDYVSPCLSC